MHYMIRIELLAATRQNYSDMAADLGARGVTDVIAGGDGNSYKLPPAEYTCNGAQWNIDNVMATARWAAAKTCRRNRVVVSEATQISWEGLEVVAAQRIA